jgi:hypothetical protein
MYLNPIKAQLLKEVSYQVFQFSRPRHGLPLGALVATLGCGPAARSPAVPKP